jgi:hypothetical protein
MVLPGTNQHRPLDTLTPTQGKKKKNLNNRQAVEKKKRHVAKTAGCPELWRVEEGHSFTQTVNKQASRRRQDWRPLPSNLGEEKACNSHGHVESTTRGGQGHFPTRTVNKQAGEGGCGTTSPSVLAEGKVSNSSYSVERSTREWWRGTCPFKH